MKNKRTSLNNNSTPTSMTRLDEAASLLNVAIQRLVYKNKLKSKKFSGLTFKTERNCSFNQALGA